MHSVLLCSKGCTLFLKYCTTKFVHESRTSVQEMLLFSCTLCKHLCTVNAFFVRHVFCTHVHYFKNENNSESKLEMFRKKSVIDSVPPFAETIAKNVRTYKTAI